MRRSSPAPVVAAAFLSAAADRSLFADRWRLLDLKHDARRLDLRLLSTKPADGQLFNEEARALADYVHITQGNAGVGFVTALVSGTWEKLDRKQRAQMRSPEDFCFERLLRQVFDRLDTQDASAALTLVLPFDRRRWMAHAALLDASLARDSRTDRLLASVNFATAAVDRRLDAARVLQASIRAEMQREPATSGNPPVPHALTAWALQSTICEIWDVEACKRRLHKFM